MSSGHVWTYVVIGVIENERTKSKLVLYERLKPGTSYISHIRVLCPVRSNLSNLC